jgi:hypothetical protein
MSSVLSMRFESAAAAKPACMSAGDRPGYLTTGEGLSLQRAERQAAPGSARIPFGDRTAYSTGEGLS